MPKEQLKKKFNKKVVFLDIDGCLTSINEGNSYLCYKPEDYHISENCFKNLMWLLKEGKAYVVISSNWRRFPDNGQFLYDKKLYDNQLPALKKMLGRRYIGDLPHDRHITKSAGVILWAEDNDVDLHDGSFKYVIIDDKSYEMHDASPDMWKRFVLCDEATGLTKTNAQVALEALNL